MQAEKELLANQRVFFLEWIDFQKYKRLLDHILDCWKVVHLITEVRVLFHDWMVLPDIALDSSVLVHEVLYMIAQPSIHLIRMLAPILVFCRVFAIS